MKGAMQRDTRQGGKGVQDAETERNKADAQG